MIIGFTVALISKIFYCFPLVEQYQQQGVKYNNEITHCLIFVSIDLNFVIKTLPIEVLLYRKNRLQSRRCKKNQGY